MSKINFLAKIALLLITVTPVFSYEKAKFNLTLDTTGQSKKSCIKWQYNKTSTKDHYDAVTGASKNNAVKQLSTLYHDSSKKKNTVPQGLRNLFLFATAHNSYLQNDLFTVNAKDKLLTITFIHRGTVYKIITDEKGIVDTEKNFFKAPYVAQNKGGIFTVKDEYLKEKSDNTDLRNIDFSKLVFENDTSNQDASYTYTGKLKTHLSKKGILKVKGSLIKTDKQTK